MLRCSKEAFAACPDSHLCGSREDATYTEGSDCDKFNQEISKHPEEYGRWISVTKRLPKRGERVLATDGMVTGEMCFSKTRHWHRYNGISWESFSDTKITHWMPLPEPPKE